MNNLDDLIKTCGAFICHAQVHRKDCFWAVKCNECNLSTNYKLDPYSSIAAWNKGIKDGQINNAPHSPVDTGTGGPDAG